MVKNVEGITSPQVPDSTKICCPRCNSTLLYLSSVLDDPNDIVRDLIFAAYDITFASGTSCQGLVALCHNCGNEFVPFWMIFDVATTDGAFVSTMTNLDAGTANTLAGLYGWLLVGTDVEKYCVIASHTAAGPTVITWAANKPAADTDGYIVISNFLPVGFTANP